MEEEQLKWDLINKEVAERINSYKDKSKDELEIMWKNLNQEILDKWINNGIEDLDGSVTIHFKDNDDTDEYIKKFMEYQKLGELLKNK